MLPFAPIACLALAASQGPAAVPLRSTEPQWREFDRVMVIVNQDIITMRQLLRSLELEKASRPTMNESENQNAQTKILTESVKTRLSVQAGQDLGADEKVVERNVQDRIDRLIENYNGVVGFSKVLEARDATIEDLKLSMREELYSTVWEDSITGQGAGVSSRPTRDRYVRPGALAFEFNNALRDPAALQVMGGTTDMFTLQTLTLDPASNGGDEKTLALALDLRRRILAGEDMADLVRRYSVRKDKNGVGDPVDLRRIQNVAPPVASFVARSTVGDVSDPVILQTKTGTLVQLVRLVEHTLGITPQLSSPEVQRTVTNELRRDLDNYRLERAYEHLHQAAYVWPEQFSARRPR